MQAPLQCSPTSSVADGYCAECDIRLANRTTAGQPARKHLGNLYDFTLAPRFRTVTMYDPHLCIYD